MILVKILPLPLFVKTNYHFLKEKKKVVGTVGISVYYLKVITKHW